MIKKAIGTGLGFMLAMGLVLAPGSASAQQQTMTLTQLIDLFVQLGIIAPDKAAQARAAATGSTTSGGTTVSNYTFVRDLTIGSRGADVTALQQFLVSRGYLTMPPGVAYGYFGNLTQAALARYQSLNNISPARGYFGPITRANVNQAVAATPPTTGGGSTQDPDDFLTGDDEGFLDDIDQLSNFSGEEVGENEDDVEILGVELTAEDADQMIDRVIVEFDTPTAGDDLDDFIEEVSVWLDGDLLGRLDVDEASHDRSDDEYTFRFTGLDGVIDEGDTAELTIAVTGIQNISSDEEGEGWTVRIPADGIRALSPNGTDDTYPSSEMDTTFTVERFASARGVELDISTASESPDSRVVEVSDDDDTDGVELLAFTLEAEGSDILILDLPITLTSTGADVNEIANRLTLEIDGEEYSENISTASTTVVVSFDDIDLTIDEGDEVTVVVMADINDLDGDFTEGDTLTASLTADNRDDIEAEDESGEDLESSDISGTALGEEMSFFDTGLEIEFVSATENVTDTSDSSTNDRGTFTIVFDVTSFGEDIYVDEDSGTTSDGVEWSVTGDSFSGTASSNLNCSGCDEGTGNFLVEEGQTERFTLTVVLTNTGASSGFFGIQIDEIGIGTGDDSTAETTITAGLEDLETDEVNLEA